MREEIVPLAQTLEAGGVAYPARVATLGADSHAFVEGWLARLEGELQLQQAARAGGK
ncbi:MAG TPA: hypothetical protein VMD79_11220 [Solirubrobacteraceae bacterium]|nr:hypothetical protein [Solirubrobacteraceae bacterium]